MRQLMRLPGAEPAVAAVAGVCLLLVLLLGLTPALTALTAHEGMTLVPSALGAPFALPSLRAVPLGSTGWPQLLCEDFASAVLVAAAVLRMRRHLRRRPEATRPRRLLAGWTALITGAATAGGWRGLVTARMVEAGPAGWLLYGAAGAAFGAVWGLGLGWLPGAAATLCVRPAQAPPAGPANAATKDVSPPAARQVTTDTSPPAARPALEDERP
ncbi:hypothetical protein [Streptomyces sp. WM6378]|uniref:hypothetical protein n=1 Tax=Streptomyces sp. WM6378 TaxID=1415557 RepID=UPI0006B021C8|nr:hypothetical protein [Streptomyces sp. WM6378]